MIQQTFKSLLGLGAALLIAGPVAATEIDITPDIIFGTGNADGSFTGETANDIEIALRAKQRYPSPANVFNYDGIDTYTFDSAVLSGPENRSIFNFEWSIFTTDEGKTIGDYEYLLEVDQDPTAGIDFSNSGSSFGMIQLYTTSVFADHAFGDATTANGAGLVAPDGDLATYNNYLETYSVSQQSWNLGFGFSDDPDAAGSYAIRLSAWDELFDTQLAVASIIVNVLAPVITEPPSDVPAPATLLLVMAGLAGLGASRRNKTQAHMA